MSQRNLLAFLFISLCWGTTWFVIKEQLGSVNPSWSVSWRFILGGLLLLVWCKFKGLPLTVPRKALPFLAVLGSLQFALNFNFVYRAEEFVPSGIPAVAYALLLVPNAILAWIFLKKPMTPRFLVGAALGIVGVGLLFLREMQTTTNYEHIVTGLVFIVLGLLCASTANVMQASRMASTYSPLTGLAWAMLSAATVNCAIAYGVAGPPTIDPRPEYWLGVGYLGVVASAICFALYFDLIRKMGPAEAAWTGVLIPIVAMTISTIFEGYIWSALSVAGALTALCGLLVALWKPKAKTD